MDFFSSQYGSQGSHINGQPASSAPPLLQKVLQKRRLWSLLEEKMLIGAFAEIMAQGWKTPNGFRNGFLIQLEQKMKIAMPNTDIRGEPHISSKYGSWKKPYRDVTQVLSNSGFNWNATTKTVEATPHVWDVFQQAHPSLSYVREKPFPFYEVWIEIYGKDRATCNGSMNFHAFNQHPEPPIVDLFEEVEDNAAKSPEAGHDQEAVQSENGNSPTGVGSRKRKPTESAAEIADVITGLWTRATESIKEVAVAIKETQEREYSVNRQKLFEIIGKLPMAIPMYEQLEAAYEIAMNPFAMDLFISLPDEAKCEMVHRAVAGRLKRQGN